VFILHADEVLQGAEIIAQVEVACGAYATANYIFTHIVVVVLWLQIYEIIFI
jgi:hypothetical protein